MLRKSVGLVVVLAACAGAALAEDQAEKGKKGQTVRGLIKKVDPSANMLILSIEKKGEVTEQVVRIGSQTKVTIFDSEGRKELVGKDVFKNPNVKEGARAAAVLDEAGKTVEVRIGTPPKE